MAKNDNLKDFLTDVADAIREKKGTSEPINPQDFSAEIASIETGGGGHQIEYLSMANVPDAEERIYVQFSAWCKINVSGAVVVGPTATIWQQGENGAIPLAIAIDFSYKTNALGNGLVTLGDALPLEALLSYGYEKITEEEFYSIN